MSKDETAISIQHLSKEFKLPNEQRNSLKERVLSFRRQSYERFHVLDDINLEVKRGEFFGIVGRNGSGKSTLLKIIGGIYQPTKGKVLVNGTLTPFIELGIGFNPNLTGKENVFLNGAILGLTRKQVSRLYPEIVAFAELEQFMDQKLKNYSSGMQVRLAFSIAIQAHNDILLIDEVLAVGDAAFQKKCFDVFKSVKKEGKTVIFVTHDMAAVEEYCDRAMLIEKSKVITIGKSYEVAREYRRLLNEGEAAGSATSSQKRFGNGAAEISKASLTNTSGKPLKKLTDETEEFVFSLQVDFKETVTNPIFGITVRDAAGLPLFLSNTKGLHIKSGKHEKNTSVIVSWHLKNIFNNGRYSISPAVAAEDTVTMLDWREDYFLLEVEKDYYLPGIIHYPHNITIK